MLCFPDIDTTKTSRNENSFKIMIWTVILLENVTNFRFRNIISEICESEFGTI